MRIGLLSRVRILRWRHDDQLRYHGVSGAHRVSAFAIDAGNLVSLSGIENRDVDVCGDSSVITVGADYTRAVAGIRLLGGAVDAAIRSAVAMKLL